MRLLVFLLPFLLPALAADEDDYCEADYSAGVGVELESPAFYLVSPDCPDEEVYKTRKKVIANKIGENWQLTADTGGGFGKVQAELIFDGTMIKIGSGELAEAGEAAANEIIKWKPWTIPKNTVDIEGSKCNPWKIDAPSIRQDPKSLPWNPQVTAPMPLEKIYEIMKIHVKNTEHILNGFVDGTDFSVLVTQLYFKGNRNGIDKDQVTDDVLAFCSLVMSYAKAAFVPLSRNGSPKQRTVIMPRTNFAALYDEVKSKIPGDLFGLFETLACYKTGLNGRIVRDKDFCDGTANDLKPKGTLGSLMFTNEAENPPVTMSIKAWIEGLASGTDLLAKFDQSIDGSIGGLGRKTEAMYNSDRLVPLFEFRGLKDVPTSGFGDFMRRVDEAIQELHR